MSTSIVTQIDGELRVSSEDVALRTESEHRAVLQLITTYIGDFEQLGHLAFEMRDGYQGHKVRIAHLNEAQATLLITFMRNSETVRAFKVELVRQFQQMKQELAAPKTLAERSLELLGELAGEVQRQAAEIATLEPKAGAWDDLASGAGDYSVGDAAKMLARAGIETGRDRLFATLHEFGWVFRQSGRFQARQTAVDSGYLRQKPQSHLHPETREVVLDAPQIRVTLRGLERLRIRLGSVLHAVEAVAS